jgi:hypothetical protein
MILATYKLAAVLAAFSVLIWVWYWWTQEEYEKALANTFVALVFLGVGICG